MPLDGLHHEPKEGASSDESVSVDAPKDKIIATRPPRASVERGPSAEEAAARAAAEEASGGGEWILAGRKSGASPVAPLPPKPSAPKSAVPEAIRPALRLPSSPAKSGSQSPSRPSPAANRSVTVSPPGAARGASAGKLHGAPSPAKPAAWSGLATDSNAVATSAVAWPSPLELNTTSRSDGALAAPKAQEIREPPKHVSRLPVAAAGSDPEADFLAILRESELEEEMRSDEDKRAAALVQRYEAELQAGASTSGGFAGLYNPPRDGDCLMRCAVEHDFGGGEASSGGGAMTADELRLAVVSCAKERARRSGRGPAAAHFEVMARPGVVMGEDELQGLADARGARVEASIP